jgi:hypothetical protein
MWSTTYYPLHWIWSIPAYVLCCLTSYWMAPSVVGQLYFTLRYRYNMFMSGMSSLFFAYALYHSFVTVTYTISAPVATLWIGSKVLEWTDTIFLLWTKKQVRVLHYWHHASTVLLFSLSRGHSGMFLLGMLLNSGIHSIMYCHYATPLPPWMRPHLTKLQIGQFIAIMAYGTTIDYTEMGTESFVLCMLIVFSYFVLFVTMYALS